MKYECALKNSSNYRVVMGENDHLWPAKGFSAWPLWFDEVFNSVKKFEIKTSRLAPDWDWNEFQGS